jgi:hypothetical protein
VPGRRETEGESEEREEGRIWKEKWKPEYIFSFPDSEKKPEKQRRSERS